MADYQLGKQKRASELRSFAKTAVSVGTTTSSELDASDYTFATRPQTHDGAFRFSGATSGSSASPALGTFAFSFGATPAATSLAFQDTKLHFKPAPASKSVRVAPSPEIHPEPEQQACIGASPSPSSSMATGTSVSREAFGTRTDTTVPSNATNIGFGGDASIDSIAPGTVAYDELVRSTPLPPNLPGEL